MNFAGCSVTEGKRYTKDVKLRTGAKLLVKCALHCASSHYISNGKKCEIETDEALFAQVYCVMFTRHGLPGVLLCCVLWASWCCIAYVCKAGRFDSAALSILLYLNS